MFFREETCDIAMHWVHWVHALTAQEQLREFRCEFFDHRRSKLHLLRVPGIFPICQADLPWGIRHQVAEGPEHHKGQTQATGTTLPCETNHPGLDTSHSMVAFWLLLEFHEFHELHEKFGWNYASVFTSCVSWVLSSLLLHQCFDWGRMPKAMPLVISPDPRKRHTFCPFRPNM